MTMTECSNCGRPINLRTDGYYYKKGVNGEDLNFCSQDCAFMFGIKKLEVK